MRKNGMWQLTFNNKKKRKNFFFKKFEKEVEKSIKNFTAKFYLSCSHNGLKTSLNYSIKY